MDDGLNGLAGGGGGSITAAAAAGHPIFPSHSPKRKCHDLHEQRSEGRTRTEGGGGGESGGGG